MLNLIQGSAYEELRKLPDRSVDCIITDPPYQSTATSAGGCFGNKNRDYLNELQGLYSGFSNDILDECCRVLKKINLYIWCNKQQFNQILTYFLAKKCNWTFLVWNKTNPIPACNNRYLNDCEYCLFFREAGVPVYGSYETKHSVYTSAINMADKKRYDHPTVKPLEFTTNMVINSTKEGDIILDPFMGSGTTGEAALRLGRSFIGIELEPKHFQTASERLKVFSVKNE